MPQMLYSLLFLDISIQVKCDGKVAEVASGNFYVHFQM